MFCPNCGANLADGAKFCTNCGSTLGAPAQPAAPQQPVYQQPVAPQQPVYQQPVYQQPAAPQQPVYQQPAAPRQPAAPGSFQQTLRQYLHFIMGGLGALAALIGLLTIFGVFDVSTTVSASGYGQSRSETEYITVSEALEADGTTTIVVGNILCGVLFLAAAAVGILYFLKVFKNMPYFDAPIFQSLVMGKTGNKPAFGMGLLGALGVVLQFVMYLLAGGEQSFLGASVKYSFGLNWISWVMLVLFAGLAVLDFCVISKKEQ